ncbi:hypothetical protein BH23PLA1_BH23PLA1_31800 [soil metagenome]
MVRILLAVTLVPLCLTLAYLILRRPFREFREEIGFDQAHELFRRQREHLEARFVAVLIRVDPLQGMRWEEACWHDEVVWARDRQTRRLLALIGVHFEVNPFDDDQPAQHATAIFEYANIKAGWTTEGRFLDETRPDEAVLLHHRLEPIVLHPRKASSQADDAAL